MVGSTLTAFVAGATGYTGREVVRALAKRGHAVTAHVRPDSKSLPRWKERFGELGAQVDATPWDSEAMLARLTELRPQIVFSLLGTTRKRATSEGMGAVEAYEKVDYGLTALLIDAAKASGTDPLFVYLSAAGFNENSQNAYALARIKAEAHLRESGLRRLIVRPSFITGDRDESRPIERVSSVVVDGLLSAVGVLGARRLRDRYQSMTAAELAEGMVRAALDPDRTEDVLYPESLR